ncbi:trans-aconitate 2-methyltransferase [Streptomyces fildesensis]|uniref:Trans-aconitate 2-methyltransferase n=1 Tax=Streptomyces fildesensis TaxID=375757 RepID=A0ABW8CGS1_9ACTN
MPAAAPAWDPQQYLHHTDHRTRPFHELLARVPALPGQAPRIADIGCGPGNVTTLLSGRWPAARVTGFDNSPEMLDAARVYAGPTPGGGQLDFRPADAAHWAPDETYDLIIANAALQWVEGHAERFPDWLDHLTPGGTLAFQVPGNYDAPSHVLLAELCASPRWRARLGGSADRRVLILEPEEYFQRLSCLGCETDVWETTYLHHLQGPDPVLEWTKGTALRPVLTALGNDAAAREEFLAEYGELLRTAYPAGSHGTVFPFRRIFVVARKAGVSA